MGNQEDDMKIAITGASGFIGSYLINKLIKTKGIEISPFDKKRCSLFDIQSLEQFVKDKDAIIHLAGLKGLSDVDVAQMYKVNVLGTANLLRAISLFRKKGVHFIFPSSFLVYKEDPVKKPINEEKNQTIPKNHYGLTKLLAEEVIKFYSRTEDIKVAILRIANVYGPVLKSISTSVPNIFIEGIKNNKAITIKGDGQLVRDLIYIEDVADAFIKTINNQKKDSLIMNICTGKATNIIDLAKMIEDGLAKKAIIKYDREYKEKAYWIGDNSKAFKEIGFKPKTDVKTGIIKTIDWYKKQDKL